MFITSPVRYGLSACLVYMRSFVCCSCVVPFSKSFHNLYPGTKLYLSRRKSILILKVFLISREFCSYPKHCAYIRRS